MNVEFQQIILIGINSFMDNMENLNDYGANQGRRPTVVNKIKIIKDDEKTKITF